MRAFLLAAVSLIAAACGDGSTARLVSADLTDGGDPGCVVTDGRDPRAPSTWTVRDGDSLRRIARKVYGDEKLWKAIRDANPGKIGRDGVIVPGTELLVPRDGI